MLIATGLEDDLSRPAAYFQKQTFMRDSLTDWHESRFEE